MSQCRNPHTGAFASCRSGSLRGLGSLGSGDERHAHDVATMIPVFARRVAALEEAATLPPLRASEIAVRIADVAAMHAAIGVHTGSASSPGAVRERVPAHLTQELSRLERRAGKAKSAALQLLHKTCPR